MGNCANNYTWNMWHNINDQRGWSAAQHENQLYTVCTYVCLLHSITTRWCYNWCKNMILTLNPTCIYVCSSWCRLLPAFPLYFAQLAYSKILNSTPPSGTWHNLNLGRVAQLPFVYSILFFQFVVYDFHTKWNLVSLWKCYWKKNTHTTKNEVVFDLFFVMLKTKMQNHALHRWNLLPNQ